MDLSTIFVALIGGGFVGFIEFLIRRHDTREDKHDEILDEIAKINEKIDQHEEILEEIAKIDRKIDLIDAKVEEVDTKGDVRNTISARIRILTFMDELIEGRRHSKDRFDQVMTDIDEYEKYCDVHKDFKNNQTASTIRHIKETYQERLAKHDFL